MTRAESIAHGRALRKHVPRSRHAELDVGPNRPEALTLLQRCDDDRVRELLPIRYGRMAASPFAFFRGAAGPMAADLAATPSSGLRVQCCGDAHLSNFGLFASPERRLVFDINDFDETLPGPWEWDVKRLAASLEIAGRENGFPAARCREIVEATVARYRRAMREFAASTSLAVWYARADAEQVAALLDGALSRRGRRGVDRIVTKAYARDHLGALARFVALDRNGPRIAAEPPLIVPLRDLVDVDAADVDAALRSVIVSYRETLPPDRRLLVDQYRLVDMARKVVGVGSVGTRCWMLLLLGRGDPDDPLFLQIKEAGPSVLEEHLAPVAVGHHGQRVVEGQRIAQAVGDVLLGWVRADGIDGRHRDFYVRQLRDWKGSVDVTAMRPSGMRAYGQLCAWTLARAHARSGDRIAIAAYLGSGSAFDVAVAEFARAYADLNERDHRTLREAIADDRLTAVLDV